MPSILVAYGTGEGQTEKVADRIVGVLTEHGGDAEAVNVERLPRGVDVGEYDAILVGASIHMGKHQRSVKKFVRTHRDALAAKPSGFFQLCLFAALHDETRQTEAEGYVDELVEETGWTPDRVGVFAGAIRYTEYGFLKRAAMKRIAGESTGDTDTSRNYEYTDWDEVERFAVEFAAFVDERCGVDESEDVPDVAY